MLGQFLFCGRSPVRLARARQMLDNWDQTLARFVKVMPTDYANALTNMKAARAKAVAAE